jgi:hypothetical protein
MAKNPIKNMKINLYKSTRFFLEKDLTKNSALWPCLVHTFYTVSGQPSISDEKDNFERIIASLGSKEISQGILIKKLCSLSPHNKTRAAVFEYNNLIQSIYTLKCILDPKILIDDY